MYKCSITLYITKPTTTTNTMGKKSRRNRNKNPKQFKINQENSKKKMIEGIHYQFHRRSKGACSAYCNPNNTVPRLKQHILKVSGS